MTAIKVEGLSKRYGKVQALDAINLSIRQGEIFGVIGPDGAGKTTLFRILTTLLLPDAGFASVDSYDVVKDYRSLRSVLGYMPGRFSLYQDLSVEENINFFASIFNVDFEENYDLIRDIYVQIEPFKHRRAGKLSGGMKQKLALCCALIHKPRILFLDEPTTGVDAVSRKEFWEMLGRLQTQGMTIVVSTPYMDEAQLCDRVALMQNASILNVDTPANIVAAYPRPMLAVQSSSTFAALRALRSYRHAKSVFGFGDSIHYTDKRAEFDKKSIEEHLIAKGIKDVHSEWITPGIEDSFMALLETKADAA